MILKKENKHDFDEIMRTVAVPVIAGLCFLFWAYSLIESRPPKVLVFPLSSMILILLYFYSGFVYGGIALCFITIVGFISIVLTDSTGYRLLYFFEILWMWGLFVILEFYSKSYENRQTCNREKEEEVDTAISLAGTRIENNKNRCSDLNSRILNYRALGNMIQLIGSTLEEEKVTEYVSECAARFVGKGAWKVKKGFQHDIFAQYSKRASVPLIVSDIRNDSRFFVKNPKFTSLAVMPLEVNQKFWGILKGVDKKPDIFDESDLRLLSVVAGIAELALNNVELYSRTREMAITDSLTGLFVQKYFKERLADEIKRSHEHNLPLTIAILDIDNFKSLNDKYGHTSGDEVLRQISLVLRHRLRDTDLISRYGGEEFGVVMMQTKVEEAYSVLNEIRQYVEKERYFLPIESFEPVYAKVTFSGGIGVFNCDIREIDDLIGLADEALYRAKKKGRNCIEVSRT